MRKAYFCTVAGLVRFLYYFLLIYLVMRFVRRHLLPFFQNVAEINRRQKRRQEVYNSGDKLRKSRSIREEGDYIDFTEIKGH